MMCRTKIGISDSTVSTYYLYILVHVSKIISKHFKWPCRYKRCDCTKNRYFSCSGQSRGNSDDSLFHDSTFKISVWIFLNEFSKSRTFTTVGRKNNNILILFRLLCHSFSKCFSRVHVIIKFHLHTP